MYRTIRTQCKPDHHDGWAGIRLGQSIDLQKWERDAYFNKEVNASKAPYRVIRREHGSHSWERENQTIFIKCECPILAEAEQAYEYWLD